MADTIEIVETPEIKHLDGTLYRVKFDLLTLIPNEVDPEESKKTIFYNPRNVSLNGKNKARGFSKPEMDELREAIRTEGQDAPFVCRWIEVDGKKVPQIVGGERRQRSIHRLRRDNAECFDRATGKYLPAKQVYDYVYCHISVMDDKTAFKHAYSGNAHSVGIGEGADAAFVRLLRKWGWSDEEILSTTGKSIAWLRDTDTLLKLDEKTFTALTEGKVNRTVALSLAEVEDTKVRAERLERALQYTTERIAKLQVRLEEEIATAKKKAEAAGIESVVAEHEGDKEAAAKAAKKEEEATESAKKRSKKLEELKESPPKANSKDLSKASKDSSDKGEAIPNPLTLKKIEKHWLPAVVTAIKQECVDADGESLGYDLEDCKLLKSVIEGIQEGDLDVLKILKHHSRYKAKLAAKR